MGKKETMCYYLNPLFSIACCCGAASFPHLLYIFLPPYIFRASLSPSVSQPIGIYISFFICSGILIFSPAVTLPFLRVKQVFIEPTFQNKLAFPDREHTRESTTSCLPCMKAACHLGDKRSRQMPKKSLQCSVLRSPYSETFSITRTCSWHDHVPSQARLGRDVKHAAGDDIPSCERCHGARWDVSFCRLNLCILKILANGALCLISIFSFPPCVHEQTRGAFRGPRTIRHGRCEAGRSRGALCRESTRALGPAAVRLHGIMA